MSSLTDERLTNLESITETLDLQTQKLESLIRVNKVKAEQGITSVTNNAYAGNYANMGDIEVYKNKLVLRNNEGDFAANTVCMNKCIIANAPIVGVTQGFQHLPEEQEGRGYVYVDYFGAGDVGKTKIYNRHIHENANISGNKLANNSISVTKLLASDVSSNAVANTLVRRDASGDIISQTASSSDNSTKVATTAFVQTAVNNLIASAPAELNTLKELADKIVADASLVTQLSEYIDASFALKSELNNKADKDYLDASFALKSDLNNKADKAYLDSSFATKVSLADLSGNLDDVVQHLDASFATKDSLQFSTSFNGLNDFSGKVGQIRFSETFAYFCTASPYVDNSDPQNPVAVSAVWKQVALSSIA